MILSETGQIAEDIYVLGHPAAPAYLVGGRRAVIIDAGFTGLGNLYAEHAGKILRGDSPADCFLTHSHFDHCGALPVLKRHFPTMRVAASERARWVLERPKAIALIRQLNQAALPMMAQIGVAFDATAEFEAFAVDQILAEGASIRLSDRLSVRVMETPGHTRDCLSFYIPERKILFSSEAAGQPDETGRIISDCLSDFAAYRHSLQRLAHLEVDMLCLGHMFVYTGSDVRDYFRRAAAACDDFLHLARNCLAEEAGSIEAAMTRIKAIEYDTNPGLKQPEPAYLLNLAARVGAVQRFLEDGGQVGFG